MAITFTSQDLNIDETAGVQLDEVASLPAPYTYLLTIAPQGTAGDDADFPQVSYDADFLKLTNVPNGTTVSDLVFTHAGPNGTFVQFSETDGFETTLKDVDGRTVYLFLDPTNANVLLGRVSTSDDPAVTPTASSPLAMAIVLDEAANHLSAGAYIVLYEAMQHPLNPNPNDVIDLTNQLFVSSATTTTTTAIFENFALVPPGNNDYAIIGPTSGAAGSNLLVTGDTPKGNVNGPVGDGTVNVSTQGLGSGSQAVGKNSTLQIDFINGGAANTAGGEAGIQYTSHIENVTEAQFSLTQVNPNNELINLTVGAGNEQGNVKGVTFRDFVGTNVNITQVQVFDAAGNLIEDSDGTPNATGRNAVTATIVNGDAVLTNLRVDYTVKVFSTEMDQIRITNTDNNNNASFDVGEIQFSSTSTTVGTDNTEVGSKVNIYDDGPSVTLTGEVPESLTVDEADFATDTIGDFSVAFSRDLGSDDGTGTFSLELAGTATSLFDTLTGEPVVLVQQSPTTVLGMSETGGEVFRVSVDADGSVTLNQSRAVVHPGSGTDTLNIGAGLINLVNTAEDGDNDPAEASIDLGSLLNITDDVPVAAADGEKPTLETDESFLSSGSQQGPDGSTAVTESFAGTFTSETGNDGPGTVSGFTLGVSSANAVSGLVDTITQQAVVLNLVDGEVIGTAGVGGDTVFTISVDEDTGEVTFTQLRSVVHSLVGDDPDDLSTAMEADLITLTANVTDGDTDPASATANIGDSFRIRDDGPTITVVADLVAMSVDETDFDQDDTTSLSALFEAVGGADGLASTNFTLVANTATGTGLFATETNTEIVLEQFSTTQVNGVDGSGNVIFEVSIDGDTLKLDQKLAIRHPTTDANEPISIAADLAGLLKVQGSADDGDTDAVNTTVNIANRLTFLDDGPSITVEDASGDYDAGATGVFTDAAGNDLLQSINVAFNSYAIGGAATDTTPTNSTFVKVNDLTYTGTIKDDFNGDGTDDTVGFTLTLDPTNDTYTVTVDTPPTGSVTKDTSQGTLKAGGPDGVRTLLFGGSESNADDVVFFGVVANASTAGIRDLAGNGVPDLTEADIEALNSPLVNENTAMNVSNAGIGINNNNLDGSGVGLQAADESFVFNPEEVVDSVKVFIDNAVGGYNMATEDLFYTVYYTDGTVGDATEVNSVTPEAGGQVSFTIDGGDNKIDAVQLTMQRGTIKVPVIQWTIETAFDPEALDLNFTATETDKDTDFATDTFSVHLSPSLSPDVIT
jgi:hypothetical protein